MLPAISPAGVFGERSLPGLAAWQRLVDDDLTAIAEQIVRTGEDVLDVRSGEMSLERLARIPALDERQPSGVICASSKAQTGTGANASISVNQTALGKTLADANGRTLYLFAPDKANVSTLSAAGRSIWPPFTATRHPAAVDGAQPSQVGAVTAGGSPAQVTYHGHPLYYFAGDRKPGETSGQGLNDFGGRWYVLSSAGGPVTAAPQASSSGGSNGGSPSSSYAY